jgi:SNF2 family DNA or RNA helicase
MKKPAAPKHLCDVEALELIWGPPPVILTAADLRGYQRWMAEKTVRMDALLLGAEMGLGKTGSVLFAVSELLATGEVTKVIVVAPLRVAEETWPEEIAKWSFSRPLSYRVITGTAEERRAALQLDAQITIINRENLLWLRQQDDHVLWPYDMMVYDEISRLKSGRKRSKPKANKATGKVPYKRLTELGVIQAIRYRTKHFVGLSGTPAPGGLIDLWGPMYAVDKGERLGSSMTSFKERWFRENVYSKKVEPLPGAEESIIDRIKDVFFSLRSSDYLKLPPVVPVDHYVTLSASEMKRYRAFEKECAIELRNAAGDPELVRAVNRGVLTGKLLQFANGSMYLGEKWDEDREGFLPKESVPIHSRKLDVLESIVNEAMGAPVLVAYSFQFDKDAIRSRFPYARFFGENRNDMRDWNAGKIRMLVTHPASAGHGLNFQYGSNIAVWYGLTWSLELYQQFNMRLPRSGQKASHVYMHRIMARRTMDESILPVLEGKGMTQDRITDRVRITLGKAA